MALIKSISGIRGTIGGKPDEALTPVDIVKYTAAFGSWLIEKTNNPKIVIGRDGRISGEMVRNLVVSTLQSLGADVVDLGLSTTPTVEMAVTMEKAGGGIIITASHNPKEWNALKLLNQHGEFISGQDGEEVLKRGNAADFRFAEVTKLGKLSTDESYQQKHIDTILNHPLVDREAIAAKNFKIVVDGINSTGATYVPALLKALGVEQVIVINEEVNGKFNHNPEPLPENLMEISNTVSKQNADLGIVVDPDVDRLCFINDDGSMFGEEYTLVAIADYFLTHKKGNTVSNLSSTRALKDITLKHGGEYFASAVGEVNVVNKMKEVNAVIGGEGNGGIIVPELHYGRDALIGIALFLTHLSHFGKSMVDLRRKYPDYYMSKNKIELEKGVDVKKIFEGIQKIYIKQPVNTEDGLKIDFDNEWVHLRTSNTEPIIRIYAESTSETTANNIAKKIMMDIRELLKEIS
ncbi:MAG: phosphoglucosamine mutase [Chitinophagaceae bacterium]|nr:phosphoglucosamine mutase [Chitinophagaceae bacterium]